MNDYIVYQGTEESLTPLHLKATDPDTAAQNVTFNIAKPPTYGRLYNRGVLVTNMFTQNDIDVGYISYESDGARAGISFLLLSLAFYLLHRHIYINKYGQFFFPSPC